MGLKSAQRVAQWWSRHHIYMALCSVGGAGLSPGLPLTPACLPSFPVCLKLLWPQNVNYPAIKAGSALLSEPRAPELQSLSVEKDQQQPGGKILTGRTL